MKGESYKDRIRNRCNIVLLFGVCCILCSCLERKVETISSEDANFFISDTIETKAEPENLPEIQYGSYEDAMEYMRNSGYIDNYRNGIIPDLARDHIEYASKLLNNRHSRFIIVDKASMQVILYNKFGEVEKIYGMACSRRYGNKHKKADNRTPEGYFTVSGIYDSTDWLYTDDNGVQSKKKGQFGPRFIRFAPQIGIHGTCAPWTIGHRSSHGCIRLTNENILDLVKYAETGMPVIVNPGSKDMAVNKREGYDTFSIITIPGGRKAEYAHENFDGAMTPKKKDTLVNELSDTLIMPVKPEIPEKENNTGNIEEESAGAGT